MKNKGRLFEFLTLFAMVVGTVIGAGIYIKNKIILEATHNPIIAIILWLVVGIACVAVVYLFLEISSSTNKQGSGTISVWAQKFMNRKIGSFFSIFQTYVYAPVMMSLFSTAMIGFALKIANFSLPGYVYWLIFLVGGIIIILLTTVLTVSSLSTSRRIIAIGTVLKFIPLVVSLISGFVIVAIFGIKDGTFGNGTPETWSIDSFEPLSFFRGFGGILFAFDGFVYICNSQKRAKHKDVVPKALLFGMIFVSIFYVLMAISLFLGSTDGSIAELLKRLFNGGQVKDSTAANVLVAIITTLICWLGIAGYSYISVVGLESDLADKVQVSEIDNIQNEKVKIRKIAIKINIITIIIHVIFTCASAFSNISLKETYESIVPTKSFDVGEQIANLIQVFSSACSCFSFAIMTSVIIAGLVNRKTNKVEVEKRKGFVVIGIISTIAIILFTSMGIFTFIVPDEVLYGNETWFNSGKGQGWLFILLSILSIVFVSIIWYIQEKQRIRMQVILNDSTTTRINK
ncbi:APC family permease [Mycoplasma yeatsii]|uniref:APC family permease n=1 Tax=Mycoplasma yeatsii TaxID=51365 RepID=UPI0005B2494E|nr:APC family permease [Mycoplasma yeatsii]AJM72204.1 putative amino acid permease [Mycoplasma yeatsii GM274B]